MKIYRLFILTVFCSALSGCVADRLAFWKDDDLNKKYDVSGLEHAPEVKSYIEAIIQNRTEETIKNADDIAYLEKSLEGDILKALRAKGYYEAQVEFSEGEDAGQFAITAGDRVRVKSVTVTPKLYESYLSDMKLSVGDALEAETVLKAQALLYKALQKESCSFDLSVSHKVVLDRIANKAAVTFVVEAGKKATFGAVTFSGQESVREGYIRKVVGWKEGACFRHDKIDAMREALLATGLFASADAVLPKRADASGVVPVEVVLKERAQRSVTAGLSYYTNDGVGATFGWEHRNFFGAGEKFNADLNLSLLEQSLKATLVKPYFLRKDQSLSFNTALDRQDTDAYEEFGVGGGFALNRKFGKYTSANTGANFKITQITETGAPSETFGLISPFVSLSFDNRDDPLDPHKGMVLRGSVTPSLDAFGESSPFIKTTFTAQNYYAVVKRLVLASRLNIGSVMGTTTDDLPATERFFAGGGGSVRGFSYQEVGPHEDGDPTGGRSLLEASAEMRYKVTDTFGGVAFVDVGHVGEKVMPTVDSMSVGAGVGVRYYTGFGPVRFDVGVPISGKENTNQKYQIYISIGQAF